MFQIQLLFPLYSEDRQWAIALTYFLNMEWKHLHDSAQSWKFSGKDDKGKKKTLHHL